MNIKTFWYSSQYSSSAMKVGRRTVGSFHHICLRRRRWAMELIGKNQALDLNVFMVSFLSKMPNSGLTKPEAFWTSMLHCFRRTVQFSREICPRTYSIVLARCLRSLFLTFAKSTKLSHLIDCIMIGCIDSTELR